MQRTQNALSKMSPLRLTALLLLLLPLLINTNGNAGSANSASAASACASCAAAAAATANGNRIPTRSTAHDNDNNGDGELLPYWRRARRSVGGGGAGDVGGGGGVGVGAGAGEGAGAGAGAGEGALMSNEIPLDLFRELENVTDYEQFFANYHGKFAVTTAAANDGDNLPDLHREARSYSTNHKRSVSNVKVKRPVSASCIPDNQIVSLVPANADSNYYYFPDCTRVKRCSGCCGASPLQCKPIDTEIVTFEVLEVHRQNHSTSRKRLVEIEIHLSCKCSCRVVAADCNAYQTHEEQSCQCKCTNSDEQQKCHQMDDKIWDKDACRCLCRNNHTCTSGTFFDDNLCKCVTSDVAIESTYFSAGPTLEDRKRFIVEATRIDTTDNSTIYDV